MVRKRVQGGGGSVWCIRGCKGEGEGGCAVLKRVQGGGGVCGV